ncbi:helix-turn-helix domain-containing protein [Bacillus badius]|uniref:helix-turn-helix domain-containing protein n=1 Tax=Bacillus badius TaxID=1455 RepID=UPI001CC19740|nr:helix-turn-helix domain-containing protein [Bacillus badius]UAT29481.1 helix-turn-helix domain-containing protein [Bacillus badius]
MKALKKIEDYPVVLNATHIAEILGISKQVAYEVMKHPTFPLIQVNRFKRVNRDAFFSWLDSQSKEAK